MYAESFILLIDRPTRALSKLFDLYTNELNVWNAIFQGISVTDIYWYLRSLSIVSYGPLLVNILRIADLEGTNIDVDFTLAH